MLQQQRDAVDGGPNRPLNWRSMNLLKTWAGLLVVGFAFALSACAGVSPSVEVGVLHTTNPTSSVDAANNTVTATNWNLGGSLKASFPQSGVVLEPCANVRYNTATRSNSGTTGWAIPSVICVEVDTAAASMR